MPRWGWTEVTVGGVALCERFGIAMTDESELGPPAKRTNYIEIPAMDGVYDATEMWTDDCVFGQRTEKLVFGVPSDLDFEEVKSDLADFLDGRRFDYTYSFDPDYTRSGRFRITDYTGWRDRRITVEVDADPWKRGPHVTVEVEAAGGVEVVLTNARRHVGPVFTVSQATLVQYPAEGDDTRVWLLPEAGSWRIDMRLAEGVSKAWINTAPYEGDTTVDEFCAMFDGKRLRDLPRKRLAQYYMTKEDRPTGKKYRVKVDYDLYRL